jgi:hypothetical protein
MSSRAAVLSTTKPFHLRHRLQETDHITIPPSLWHFELVKMPGVSGEGGRTKNGFSIRPNYLK